MSCVPRSGAQSFLYRAPNTNSLASAEAARAAQEALAQVAGSGPLCPHHQGGERGAAGTTATTSPRVSSKGTISLQATPFVRLISTQPCLQGW
jgi:hypothetical protein